MLGSKSNGELGKDELDAARLGFKQLLRCKRFSPRFIENHGEDLFGTATLEYSRKLAAGERIENPAGWLITCAWRRTKSKLEAEQDRPRQVSTEASGPLVDEAGEGPEDVLLDEDRFRKVREAVQELSAKQRRVLVLSYFEGFTVREAGRRLGWHSSKAQRAHEGAKNRLHGLLGVRSADELEVEIGLAAYLSLAAGHSARAPIPGVDLLERAVQKSAEGLAALKHQAATTYRAVDPTPLAAARPGTVATVVAGCIAVGGGATYCVEQGVSPLGAARGLVAANAEDGSPEESPAEPVEPPPVATPPPEPLPEETPIAEEVPPHEVEEPAPEPPPPPPEQTFEPSSPDYPAYEATASEASSSPPTAPQPAPADDGPQFLGEP